MAHMTRARRFESDRPTLYQDITDTIVAELEAGRVPWVQPWGAARAPLDMPHNAASGHRYSGINVLILWGAVIKRGFSTHAFLTFRQALERGGNVRRGESGTTVVYAHRFVPKAERRRAEAEARAPDAIPFLKRFTVFNLDQCENLPADLAPATDPIPDGLIVPQAEALIAATGADFRIGGGEAYYNIGADFIRVPRPDAYFDPVNWHRTAFHELGHWTGHPSRLARDMRGVFGSVDYGREELVAEMAGAFVCASLGIVPTVRHADYIGAWLDLIREDERAIVRAASAASKAAEFILAYRDAALGDAQMDRRAA